MKGMKKLALYRTLPVIIIIVAAVMVMITFSGCDAKEKQDENQNQKSLSLSEYLEESSESWFLTGKKEYTKPDGSELSKEDFAEKDVFIDIVTIPSPDTYYAMHVPNDISVTVETAQGDVLHSNLPNAPHGEGDYLICTINEDGGPDLSDVWILNGLIFPDCYDTSHMNK